MKTFVIKFRTGMEVTEQAERYEFTKPKLVLFDEHDRAILIYQDSDIVSCEQVD